MLGLAQVISKKIQDPKFWRHIHATSALIWVVQVPPALIWWKDSITYVVIMSLWACIMGSVSAWQGTRAEEEAKG